MLKIYLNTFTKPKFECKSTHYQCVNVLGVECGEVGSVLPPHLKVAVISREVGGRAVFSCTPGYGLRGPHETVCLLSGEWASNFPTCVGAYDKIGRAHV